MRVGDRRIVSIPYSYEMNDSPFIYYRNGTIEEFENLIRRQFDVLYDEGAGLDGLWQSACIPLSLAYRTGFAAWNSP